LGPKFCREFPQASTGKYCRPQFLHKREMFFDCGTQLSAAEWVQRKRWISQRLPNDDCGDTGGSWQFSRVNCQGHSETRASANRLPGHCGLLHFPLLRIAALQPVLVKVALTRERCRTSTFGPPSLAAGWQEERSTNDAARMAGPSRICFWA
jgi:hypothetical protein